MPLVSAIKCADVTIDYRCNQLKGCSWSTSCSGTFAPTCVPPTCYYVDGMTPTTGPDGTSAKPYNTLTDAFTKLASANGTLVVINNLAHTSVTITKSVSVAANFTIM